MGANRPSRSPAKQGRHFCGAGCETAPQGQLICPEEQKEKGNPKTAKRFWGTEANACGFKKGDRGLILP